MYIQSCTGHVHSTLTLAQVQEKVRVSLVDHVEADSHKASVSMFSAPPLKKLWRLELCGVGDFRSLLVSSPSDALGDVLPPSNVLQNFGREVLWKHSWK